MIKKVKKMVINYYNREKNKGYFKAFLGVLKRCSCMILLDNLLYALWLLKWI